MSKEVLTEKCSLPPTYIGQVERGEKNATLESISKIAAGLNVSLSTLFENIDGNTIAGRSCAGEACDLIQELPTGEQEKMLKIIQEILELK